MDLEEIYDLAEELNGRPIPGVRMSEEEFVAWAGEEIRAEWVDGEIILMAPVSDEHADPNNWLIALIRLFIEERDLGISRSDMFVRFESQRRRRVPDLFFISEARRSVMRRGHCEGAPDLAIEIISTDSHSRDWREKFGEYEKAGVREYWIIDPFSRVAEIYRLVGKKYQLVEERDGVVASAVLSGFRLRIADLWQRPLPKVASVLKWMRSRS